MLPFHRLNPHWFFISICLFFWGAFAPLGLATHEADHRFTVYGSVRDGSTFPGKPLKGKEVVVRDVKSGKVLNSGVTNRQGLYSLLLHIHNKDLRKLIKIQSQGAEETLELQFDPNDKTTERRERVDLIVFPK